MTPASNTPSVPQRVIVCGSREHMGRSRQAIRRLIAERLAALPPGSVIVHGAAKGVDGIAEQEAERLGLPTEPHPAKNYQSYTVGPRQAPLHRNKAMAALGADLCLAFWNGHSTGTAHMMTQANLHGIPVEMIW